MPVRVARTETLLHLAPLRTLVSHCRLLVTSTRPLVARVKREA
jgi:hypothetical protein